MATDRFRTLLAGFEREAWLRFFIGLFGLLLAFTFALLSSGYRDEGNVLATAITASAALLMSGVVAVSVVPYLAKRAALERLRFAVDYDLTREGIVYLLVALVIGIAALNTGNNLLFIIVSAMLAAVLVSGAASSIVLYNLRLDVALPDPVFARKPFLARITLRNDGRLPSYSVSVVPGKRDEKKHWRWQRATFRWPSKRPEGEEVLRLRDWQLRRVAAEAAPPPILQSPVYFPFLPRREASRCDVELCFPRRGVYHDDSFGLATRFPFSFLKKTRHLPVERELVMLPSVDLEEELLTVLPAITGEFESFVQGRGYDLYRIREYVPGDAARHIDWKATARSGGVKVREFTREDERRLRIVWDNPAPGALPEAEYERGVELAASLAWHFADTSTELCFAAPRFKDSGEPLDFLRYLARVNPGASDLELEQFAAGGTYNVILTTRPRGSLPTNLWSSSYVIFLGSNHDSHRTAASPAEAAQLK